MGVYVNPMDQSKEEFLRDHGTLVGEGRRGEGAPAWPSPEGTHYVCLVDNGIFTAAGIMYEEKELTRWVDPEDHRYKLWWVVPTEKIKEVSDWKGYLD